MTSHMENFYLWQPLPFPKHLTVINHVLEKMSCEGISTVNSFKTESDEDNPKHVPYNWIKRLKATSAKTKHCVAQQCAGPQSISELKVKEQRKEQRVQEMTSHMENRYLCLASAIYRGLKIFSENDIWKIGISATIHPKRIERCYM